MGVTWHELQETPAYIVGDYIAVMEAEAAAERQRQRAAERRR